MPGVEKYNAVAQAFLLKVDEADLELRLHEDVLYVYQNGSWSPVGKHMQSELDVLMQQAGEEESFAAVEKWSQLWRHTRNQLRRIHPKELDKSGLIALPNGTLDPKTFSLFDHDPDHMTTRSAAIEYKPGAKCPRWLKLMDNMLSDKTAKARKQYIDFLQCFFGVALVGYRNYGGRQFRKLVCLYGPERTGKTTIADTLRELLGDSHVASDNVEQLCSRFGLAGVLVSRAVISDDAASLKSKVDAKVLKKLITGEPMTADIKGKSAVNFSFQGPVLITTNALPEVRDATHALYGRTVVLRLERQFKPEDVQEHLDGCKTVMEYLNKYDELPGILNWALAGLAKLDEYGAMPDVDEATEASVTWRAENDPVYAFLAEHCEYDAGVLNYTAPIAAAISAYAESQMGERVFSVARVANLVGREAQNVIEGVKRGRWQRNRAQTRCFMGLKLKPSGEVYVRQAMESGKLAEGKWEINVPVL